MTNPAKKPKRPRDANQLAKFITDLATGEALEKDPDEGKDPAAVALGRKGGKSRASSMTPERRAEIAKKAASANHLSTQYGRFADHFHRVPALQWFLISD